MRTTEHDVKRQFNEIAARIESTYLFPRVQAVPRFLWVAVSTACDLRCGFCPRQYIEPVDSGFMDLEQFRAVAPQFTGMAKAALFGLGDPFLNKRFFDYVDLCHEQGIEVTATANGMQISEDVARRAVESGMEELGISMDAATPELFKRLRPPGDLDTICRNVRRVTDLKKEMGVSLPRLVIPCTASTENIHEPVPMIRLAHQLGVEAVCFSDLVAMREEDRRYCLENSPVFERNYREAEQLGKELGLAVGRFRQKPLPWLYVPAPGAGRPHGCTTIWEHFHIERRGETKYCCYLPDQLPGVFEKPVHEAWNSEGFIQLRDDLIHGRLRNPCRGCQNLVVNSPERVSYLLGEAERMIDESAVLPESDRARLRAMVQTHRDKAAEVVGLPFAPPRAGFLRRLARRTLPQSLRHALRDMIVDPRSAAR